MSTDRDLQVADIAPEEIARLDGTVRIRVSRYLHLDTDLVLREQFFPATTATMEIEPNQVRAEQSGATSVEDRPNLQTPDFRVEQKQEKPATLAPALQLYRISEHRRIRSNELHYLDHPRFGMIIKVSPVAVEIPDPVIDAPVSEEPEPSPKPTS